MEKTDLNYMAKIVDDYETNILRNLRAGSYHR
jgi:hypothetical protein